MNRRLYVLNDIGLPINIPRAFVHLTGDMHSAFLLAHVISYLSLLSEIVLYDSSVCLICCLSSEQYNQALANLSNAPYLDITMDDSEREIKHTFKIDFDILAAEIGSKVTSYQPHAPKGAREPAPKKPSSPTAIDYSKVPKEIGEEIARQFVKHRKALKAPLTQFAFDSNMKRAMECNKIGIKPYDAVAMTIDAGWKKIDLEWLQNQSRTWPYKEAPNKQPRVI